MPIRSTRALFIDPEAREKLRKLMEYASKHIYSTEDLAALSKGGDPTKSSRPAAGEDPNLVVQLFDGYRIVLSREIQPSFGLCNHLSVSVDGDGYPNPIAVSQIMKELNMGEINNNMLSRAGTMWLERENRAVNVLTVVIN